MTRPGSETWVVTDDLPLIAVTGRISPSAERIRGEAYSSGQRYSTALVRAGAQPVILPPVIDGLALIPPALDRIDAVVLHGGGDVDPRRYGEVPTSEELFGIMPDHDEFELAVLRAALEQGVPVLAICRVLQLLNVAMGGTLHQHLGTEDHWHRTHPIQVEPTPSSPARWAPTVRRLATRAPPGDQGPRGGPPRRRQRRRRGDRGGGARRSAGWWRCSGTRRTRRPTIRCSSACSTPSSSRPAPTARRRRVATPRGRSPVVLELRSRISWRGGRPGASMSPPPAGRPDEGSEHPSPTVKFKIAQPTATSSLCRQRSPSKAS